MSVCVYVYPSKTYLCTRSCTRSMGFTKAQRLKGLKKQLRNLGYDVVTRGGSAPEAEVEPDVESGEERGAKTVAALRARDEAW